jgi:hypothetical protein
MSGSITTAMPTSFKSELFAGAHCFGGTVTATGNTASSDTISSISSLAGVTVGMMVQESHGDLPAGAVVADIVNATTIKTYPNATGTHTGGTLTFNGDLFMIALIRHAPAGTYGPGNVNYTDVTGNSDEVSGTGYTAGGLALDNVSPAISGTTAFVNFGGTISWTSATIDSDGCIIYNSNNRLGGTSGTNATGAGRAAYIGYFGSRQTVSNGTFTIVMPTPSATQAILRLQ